MYKAHNCRLNHSFRIFLKGSSSKKKGTKRTEFSDNVKKHLQDWFNKNIEIDNIKSIFDEDTFVVKIPFKYSKPIVKIQTNINLTIP